MIATAKTRRVSLRTYFDLACCESFDNSNFGEIDCNEIFSAERYIKFYADRDADGTFFSLAN